jgi:DNA polymerase
MLRGEWHEYKGIKVLCAFHPSYALRNPSAKEGLLKDIEFMLKEVRNGT